MNTLYFLPLFDPDTRQPLTKEDLDEQIAERQALLRKHKDHAVMAAVQAMLQLQAARMTMQAMDSEVLNREHLAGQAYGVSYVTSLLRAITEQPDPEAAPADG